MHEPLQPIPTDVKSFCWSALGRHAPHNEVQFHTHRSEQLLEERLGQHVPRDGVRDGRKDPVELPEGRLALRLAAGDAVNELLGDAVLAQQAAGAEPAQSNLKGGEGERGGESKRQQATGYGNRTSCGVTREEGGEGGGRRHSGNILTPWSKSSWWIR